MFRWLSDKGAELMAVMIFVVFIIFIKWDEGKYGQSFLICVAVVFIFLIGYYIVKFFLGLFF